MRHVNIPVFIPHLGCPNACVFCNQRAISGHTEFDEKDVSRQIAEAASTLHDGDEAEIAFFGGSFTGIDRDLMLRLLLISDSFIASSRGLIASVRCSTRPDYIDGEILDILARHHVKTVELGLQSMNDEVLAASRRGHDADTARRACVAVKKAGFSLIGQMMIGLPRSDGAAERATAAEICDLNADGARVYPTVVFRRTELCSMMLCEQYTPLSENDAVARTRDVLDIFDRRGVPVIRVGLCASENLASPDEVAGGPNHPALGELAMGELFFNRTAASIDLALDKYKSSTRHNGAKPDALLYVPRGAMSRAVGQHRRNIRRLEEKYCAAGRINSIRILEKDGLIGYNIQIDLL